MTQTNLSTKQKQTHRQRTCLWLPGGEGVWGLGWEFGISRCKHVMHRMDEQQGPTVQHREI